MDDKCAVCGEDFGLGYFVRCPVCWVEHSIKKDAPDDIILEVLYKMGKEGIKIEEALILYDRRYV